jgi:hypothetical protein
MSSRTLWKLKEIPHRHRKLKIPVSRYKVAYNPVFRENAPHVQRLGIRNANQVETQLADHWNA